MEVHQFLRDFEAKAPLKEVLREFPGELSDDSGDECGVIRGLRVAIAVAGLNLFKYATECILRVRALLFLQLERELAC